MKNHAGKIPIEKDNILSPVQDAVITEGTITYGIGNRAWNVIRIKTELLNKFPQLRNRDKKFNYKLVLHNSKEDAMKAVKNKKVVPIFLFLCEKDEGLVNKK